jgi:hypothetical protein
MKCDAKKFIPWIISGYSNTDPTNTFDMAIEYASDKIPIFPKVCLEPGSDSLPGFKSYLLFPGLLHPEFEGGSVTWKNSNAHGEYDATYVVRKWILYQPVVHHVKNFIKSRWILPQSVAVMKRQYNNSWDIYRSIASQEANLGGLRIEMRINTPDIELAYYEG